MPEYSLLTKSDNLAVQEILDAGYENIKNIIPFVSIEGKKVPSTPDSVGQSSVCREASDAMTRAALSLGILASREVHAGHAITSFSPPGQLPAENDLILCTTWGQFSRLHFMTSHITEYFGPRRAIAPFVSTPGGLYHYGANYSSDSVVFKQMAYTDSVVSSTGYAWLTTTPEDIITGKFPIGHIPFDSFPSDQWQHPAP